MAPVTAVEGRDFLSPNKRLSTSEKRGKDKMVPMNAGALPRTRISLTPTVIRYIVRDPAVIAEHDAGTRYFKEASTCTSRFLSAAFSLFESYT